MSEAIWIRIVLDKSYYRTTTRGKSKLVSRWPNGKRIIAETVCTSGVNDCPTQTHVRSDIVTSVPSQARIAINLAIMHAMVDIKTHGREAVAKVFLDITTYLSALTKQSQAAAFEA